MKVSATLNNLRIAPRKVRLVTRPMAGMDATEAQVQLSRQAKKSVTPLLTLLRSAVANATNNFGLDKDNLRIQTVRVGDGLRLKRWLPRAFGRATPLLRRCSNVTIILEERVEGKNRVVKRKPEMQVVVEASAEKHTLDGSPESKTEKSFDRKEEAGRHPDKRAGGKFVKKIFQRKAT